MQLLLKDAEQNKEWDLIGKTLGRLALDPKLAPVAIKLSKRWLTLSEHAREELIEKSDQRAAERAIGEHFLSYVMHGKGQERTLREIATHFRKLGKIDVAECFWEFHRQYVGANFGNLIFNEEIELEDVGLIANTLFSLEDLSTCLLAIRNHASKPFARKIINTLVDKAIKRDDKEFSHLKGVVETLYAGNYDTFAKLIHNKVAAVRGGS